MRRIILTSLMIALGIVGFFLLPVRGAEAPSPSSITVEAEGKTMAIPDLATLTIEVETQAVSAAAAAQQNALQADSILKALRQIMGPQDKARTLGYRLSPVYSPKDKSSPPEINAYRAANRLEVKVMDVSRLSGVLDTALKNGASQVNGPFWSHSRIEELQRQAAVDAWERARRLAESLAQAAGLKIKGVDKIATGVRFFPRAQGANLLATKAAPATPIEVGEEEVKAHLQASFLVSP